ncbi:translation initiation factor IF-2-like [Monodelphis domestica]|uniref:translation initiation factor IF-2-like n=1 Tax=Monodelphis domestica TaxID=13616 RepID=UPI0024E21C2A|nr:translation initiation factor IF-2-like [Monodelphis domestica]XP_056681747.1 translation initiation factor IF-2-like [Monodelphis domestica]XP_056681748.1 translation initiation factor IF-2-like [Monodelphis domestica]XP_056681749.1 translation initiation factor IF-2-like [Monodelphis domestica]
MSLPGQVEGGAPGPLSQARREGGTDGRREGWTDGRRDGQREGGPEWPPAWALATPSGVPGQMLARMGRIPAWKNDTLKAPRPREGLAPASHSPEDEMTWVRAGCGLGGWQGFELGPLGSLPITRPAHPKPPSAPRRSRLQTRWVAPLRPPGSSCRGKQNQKGSLRPAGGPRRVHTVLPRLGSPSARLGGGESPQQGLHPETERISGAPESKARKGSARAGGPSHKEGEAEPPSLFLGGPRATPEFMVSLFRTAEGRRRAVGGPIAEEPRKRLSSEGGWQEQRLANGVRPPGTERGETGRRGLCPPHAS